VHGYVISGAWRYAERPWTATAGSYVFEPPGGVHTLLGEGAESLTVFSDYRHSD
jgi:2,4'-dihydroxyacetophenone dioxygenase